MDSLFPRYVFPIPEIARRRSIEDGAAVYMLGTSLHFVTPDSPVETEMVAAGAVRVGTLRFDPDPTERFHPHRRVRVPRDRAGRR